jgi:agmatine deiminase
VRIDEAPIGDIWLRDTGPIFVREESGALAASAFRFNGWGGKYELPEDGRIADIVARLAGARLRRFPDFVSEGGALEADGEGTVITTRQCLLNPNRNPGLCEREIEGVLRAAIGAEKVIWLDEGLKGDHTDGHVDNLARFIGPGRVVCQRPYGDDDPNAEVLNVIRRELARATGSSGRRLEVIEIPSPGLALFEQEPDHPREADGDAEAPASHMNFYIANHSIVMPTYAALTGDELAGEEALTILQSTSVRKHVIGLDSSHLLTGGGSFHCISQQQPA